MEAKQLLDLQIQNDLDRKFKTKKRRCVDKAIDLDDEKYDEPVAEDSCLTVLS